MIRSDFIGVLSSLSDDEFHAFFDLVKKGEIRLQNQPSMLLEDLYQHFSHWRHLYREQKSLDLPTEGLQKLDSYLGKQEIHQRLFPGKNYQDQTLRNMASKAFAALKIFISEHLDGNRLEQQFKLLRFYLDRGHTKQYKKQIRELESSIQDLPETYTKNECLHRLEEIKLEYRIKNKVPDHSFSKLFHRTRRIFALRMLQIQIGMVSSHRATGKKVNLQELENLLGLLHRWQLDKHPHISIWARLARLELHGPTIEKGEIQEILHLIHQHHKKIPPEDLLQMHLELYNILVRSKRHTQVSHNEEIFKIWRSLDEKGLLVGSNGISQHHLICTVVAGIRVKDFDWISHFLEKSKGRTNGEESAEVEALAHLIVEFHIGTPYHLILKKASRIRFVSTKYELRLRSLIAITLYRMGEYELVERKYETMRKYISGRKDISPNVLQAYLAFFRELKNMAKAHLEKKSLPSHFRDRISSTLIAEKEWILSSIEKKNLPST